MLSLWPSFNGTTSRHASMEADVAASIQSGFRGLELKRWKLDEFLERKSLADLRRLLGGSGLAFPSLGPYQMIALGTTDEKRASLEKVRAHAAIAAELGVPGLVMSFDEPRRGPAPADRAGLLSRLVETACEYAATLQPSGLSLGLECLGGQEVFRGPLQALAILKRARNTSVVLDTFHFYRNGVTPDAIGRVPPERILVLHVSDCDPLPLDSLEDAHRLYPGLGVIPLAEMLVPALRQGFSGFISVEAPRPEYWAQPVDQVCPVAMTHLRQLMDRLRLLTDGRTSAGNSSTH